MSGKKVAYVDITKEWSKNIKHIKNKVIDAKYYIDDTGNKYYVDNKNVVLDYSEKEKNTAIWLQNITGSKITMLPRINYPKGISTADYLINNEKFDLKEILGSNKNVIDSSINRKKEQAKNFIFDITKCKLNTNLLLKQVKHIYQNPHRNWVDITIIKRKERLIKVYKRKKEID